MSISTEMRALQGRLFEANGSTRSRLIKTKAAQDQGSAARGLEEGAQQRQIGGAGHEQADRQRRMNFPAGDLADDAHGGCEHRAILSEESQMIFFPGFISRLRLAQACATRRSLWCPGSDIRMMPRQVRLRMSEPKGHRQISDSSVVLDLTFAENSRRY